VHSQPPYRHGSVPAMPSSSPTSPSSSTATHDLHHSTNPFVATANTDQSVTAASSTPGSYAYTGSALGAAASNTAAAADRGHYQPPSLSASSSSSTSNVGGGFSLPMPPTGTTLLSASDAAGRSLIAAEFPPQQMMCHTFSHAIVLEAHEHECLILSDPNGANVDGSLQVEAVTMSQLAERNFSMDRAFAQVIYGCLGVIRLLSARFLITVLEVELVGKIRQAHVLRTKRIHLIPIPRGRPLTEDERRCELKYQNSLNEYLQDTGFYFSHQYDLSRRAQSITVEGRASGADLAHGVLLSQCDLRFVWNRSVASALGSLADRWIIPVIDGFISINQCHIQVSHFVYVLISRRECERTGTRFNTRGADPLGFTANYVETESMVIYLDNVSSFVQIRGSIPLLWTQFDKTLKPKPTVQVASLFSRSVLRTHLQTQLDLYGPQVLVSLIDQQGGEHPLGEEYETQVRLWANPYVFYFPFDFHEECKNNRYENLALLLNQVQSKLDEQGYFLKDSRETALIRQHGVVRTNCIDCLDRTNVVQSLLAKHVLQKQMAQLGILVAGHNIELYPMFDGMFKNIWADNADTMSKRYTGTGALKTDFTRTGKRGMRGTIADGINSTKRLMNKSFKDSQKQTAMELFLGEHDISRYDHVPPTASDGKSLLWPVVQYTSSRHPALLEISEACACFYLYRLDTFRRKRYPFVSVAHVIRWTSSHRMLEFVFTTADVRKYILFRTPLERHEFLTRLLQYCPQLVDQGFGCVPNTVTDRIESLSLSDSATGSSARASLGLRASILVTGWNASSFVPSPSGFPEWLPLGKDVYVLGVTRCMFPVLGSFFFREAAMLSLLFQAKFGPSYQCLVAARTQNTLLLLMCRTPIVKHLNNVQVSFISVKEPTPKPTAKKSGWTDKLKKKFKQYNTATPTEELRNIHQSPYSDDVSVPLPKSAVSSSSSSIGAVVKFNYLETSFTVINCPRHSSALVYDKDILASSEHAFWLGMPPTNALPPHRWIHLGGDERSVTSLLYFSSYASSVEPLANGVVKMGSTFPMVWCAASFSSVFYPTPVEAPRDHSCKITLRELSATSLRPADDRVDPTAMANPYLVVTGPFLQKVVATRVNPRTLTPHWPDILVTESILPSLEHMAGCYIQVVMFDSQERSPKAMGVGYLSLREACTSGSAQFKVELWLNGYPCGSVCGQLHVDQPSLMVRSSAESASIVSVAPTHRHSALSAPHATTTSSSSSSSAGPASSSQITHTRRAPAVPPSTATSASDAVYLPARSTATNTRPHGSQMTSLASRPRSAAPRLPTGTLSTSRQQQHSTTYTGPSAQSQRPPQQPTHLQQPQQPTHMQQPQQPFHLEPRSASEDATAFYLSATQQQEQGDEISSMMDQWVDAPNYDPAAYASMFSSAPSYPSTTSPSAVSCHPHPAPPPHQQYTAHATLLSTGATAQSNDKGGPPPRPSTVAPELPTDLLTFNDSPSAQAPVLQPWSSAPARSGSTPPTAAPMAPYAYAPSMATVAPMASSSGTSAAASPAALDPSTAAFFSDQDVVSFFYGKTSNTNGNSGGAGAS